ncbi:S41 family peptidase [Actinoplanes sp. NPDC026670]|uniref:S41 family peptidase n=1 Tax=Actinoplanes sp. NPDC026670 TaxID=3154700 RepID=UPI0033DACF91
MAETVAAVAGSIAAWTRRLLPDETRAGRLAAALAAEFGAATTAIDEAGCRRIERVCHRFSRHLTLEFDSAGRLVPDEGSPTGWPPPDAAAILNRGAGVRSAERDGDVGTLRIDSLEPWRYARRFVTEAAEHLAGCRELVLDLRHNGGGEMDTMAAVAGLVLGQGGVPLVRVTTRTSAEQWHTPEPGPAVSWAGRATVLTGAGTYSSGECLAYVLQQRGVPVAGEATAGAADHCTPVHVSPHVTALIPYGMVVDLLNGGNWEGTGVVPDIAGLC